MSGSSRGQSTISASSLYNKLVRGQPNPYRVLFDAWDQNIESSKFERSSNTSSNSNFTSMTDSDFASIGSDIVKFKVQCLYSELKSARHQINILKQIQNLPLIESDNSRLGFRDEEILSQKESFSRDNTKTDELSEYIDIIHNFAKMNKKLEYDEEGCLVAKTTIRKGDILSDLSFKVAIEAAIKSLQACVRN